LNSLLHTAIKAAIEAGNEILKIYEQDFTVNFKDDRSPLTEADLAAHKIILETLGNELPILSEESSEIPFSKRKNWTRFWLVDPLDGTKEFIKKNGEFTVNIALIENGIPVLGVVYVPVTKELFWGVEKVGSFQYSLKEKNSFSVEEIILKGEKLEKNFLPETFTIVASRSHLSPETETFIQQCKQQHGEIHLVNSGSSLKLCQVATRKANVYPRLAPTMEWDTAAAHAIAKFAGCKVYDYHTRQELQYNKENLLNPWFVVELS
jgi:3'(2'), 5'-bisphosphate nucleotidase